MPANTGLGPAGQEYPLWALLLVFGCLVVGCVLAAWLGVKLEEWWRNNERK